MTFFRRSISIALIVSMLGMGLPLSAQAGMVPTPTVAAAPAKERIMGLIERSDVRAQLQSFGVNPADAKARVAALSDEEATQLAARLDSLPAGGDGGASIIGAAVLIFLVLLLTDILGFTHVFPFTKSIK
ncbi:MAG TPA: PA2779 family protein [Steroidobacteraceae bacterium]|nr:PA2779 family protein [Steroidobacteraceae bacterium]